MGGSEGKATRVDEKSAERLLELGEADVHRAPRVALARGQEALELTRSLGNELTVTAFQLTGSAHHALGDFPAAIEALSEGLALQQRLERRGAAEASLLQRLADAHLVAGDLPSAEEECESACSIAEAQGHMRLKGAGLATLGSVRHRQGRSAEALDFRERALRIARQEEDLPLEMRALIELAQLDAQDGDAASALERLEWVLARARETGHIALVITALTTLALVLHRVGRGAQMLPYAEEACRTSREIGDRYHEAEAMRVMYIAFRHRGDLARAHRYAEQAAAMLKDSGAKIAYAAMLSGVADLLYEMEEFAEAREASERVLAIANECDWAYGRFIAWLQMARHRASQGEHGAALETLDQALAAATETGDQHWMAAVHGAASAEYAASGEPGLALERHKLYHECTLKAFAVRSEAKIQALRVRHEVAQAQREVEEAVDGLERSEALNRSVLDSLGSHVVVLDGAGSIIAANEPWLQFGRAAGATDSMIGVGADYLEVCRNATGSDAEDAHRALAGILEVLRGERSSFECEYECPTPREELWFRMSVTPLVGGQGGVVISHEDTTARKQAEVGLASALAEVSALRDRLEAEKMYLSEEIERDHDIVGRSPALRETLDLVGRVAPTDVTVLLLGETGTGKEMFARAIHARSGRQERPLVKVDCAALPSGLIESELLGHEKGAFTGAHRARPGRFELADGGTIFLDEVGELSLDLQTKLLRVLQDGEFERLGSATVRKVDVRVIAATNRELEEAVARGEFRADLYYRLNIFPIQLPPLRERTGDIPLLTWHFIRRNQERFGRKIGEVPRPTMEALERYLWPGNVRELSAVVERAMILSTGPTLFPPALPVLKAVADAENLEERERAHVLSVLEACGWRIKGAGNAAARLGLPASTLRHRMKRLGIRRPSRG